MSSERSVNEVTLMQTGITHVIKIVSSLCYQCSITLSRAHHSLLLILMAGILLFELFRHLQNGLYHRLISVTNLSESIIHLVQCLLRDLLSFPLPRVHSSNLVQKQVPSIFAVFEVLLSQPHSRVSEKCHSRLAVFFPGRAFAKLVPNCNGLLSFGGIEDVETGLFERIGVAIASGRREKSSITLALESCVLTTR